jgi:hypothetical protein
LLFTSRKRARLARQQLIETNTHQLGCVLDVLARLFVADLVHFEEEGEISFIGKVWIQRIILENNTKPALTGRDGAHILPVV